MSPSDTIKEKSSGQCKETCIGFWRRNFLTGKNKNEQSVCMGINIVRVSDNVNINNVQPTNTLGLQIIIQDTDNANGSTDESIFGLDIQQSYISQYLKNFREKAQQLSNMSKEMLYSEETKKSIDRAILERFKQFRDWSEKFWK